MYGCMVDFRDERNLRGKKLYRTNQGSNFLGGSFSNGDNARAPIQFRRESQPQHFNTWFFLKSRPIHFHINSTSVNYQNGQTKPVEFFRHWNQQAMELLEPWMDVRMEPWRNPALTGYSFEDFPSRTTRSCLLRRKEEIRPNIWPEIMLLVMLLNKNFKMFLLETWKNCS